MNFKTLLLAISVIVVGYILWKNVIKSMLYDRSYPTLPVYDSYKDAPKNAVFRLCGDEQRLIRFNSVFDNEEGFFSAIERWNVGVAGVSHQPEAVLSFAYGEKRRVVIKKKALKKYPHALAVMGTWQDSKTYIKTEQLGYVPNDDARQISTVSGKYKNPEILAKLNMIFLPTEDKDPGIRIDIGLFSTDKTAPAEK